MCGANMMWFEMNILEKTAVSSRERMGLDFIKWYDIIMKDCLERIIKWEIKDQSHGVERMKE